MPRKFCTEKLLGFRKFRQNRALLAEPRRTVPHMAQTEKVGPRGGVIFSNLVSFDSSRRAELNGTILAAKFWQIRKKAAPTKGGEQRRENLHTQNGFAAEFPDRTTNEIFRKFPVEKGRA